MTIHVYIGVMCELFSPHSFFPHSFWDEFLARCICVGCKGCPRNCVPTIIIETDLFVFIYWVLYFQEKLNNWRATIVGQFVSV